MLVVMRAEGDICPMQSPPSRRASAVEFRGALLAALFLGAGTSCSLRDERAAHHDTLVVLQAGSLARPVRAALDSFTARTGTPVATISAGSVEAARRITELDDVPDVVALADEEVFPALLMPNAVAGYSVFARNRVVIAMSPRRAQAGVDSTNWFRALTASDVEVGRSNPDLDPAGYRAIMVLRLASAAYNAPGLERAVLARSPERNVRPKSADLLALLETGALDYAFVYETSARAANLRFIRLPAGIDLGDDAHAAEYARVSIRIAGGARGDSVTVHGTPIRYALAVPREAPHPASAKALAGYLLSPDGLAAMRQAGLETVAPHYVPADSAVRQRTAQ
jgi:molybdate/tungstate transport system substrate-binding protein